MTSISLDGDERHDHAAEAVDERGSAGGAPPRRAAGSVTPRSASGMSAMITSALKMTAERMALAGLPSFMTLSAQNAELGGSPPRRLEDGEAR